MPIPKGNSTGSYANKHVASSLVRKLYIEPVIALAFKGYFKGSRCNYPIIALCSTDRAVGGSCADFPVYDICKLIHLMDTGRSQNFLRVPETESCTLKNTGIFRYNPLSIKAVIPYILLACQIHCHYIVAYGRCEKLVATTSRSCWRHSIAKRHHSGDWFLYCITSWDS